MIKVDNLTDKCRDKFGISQQELAEHVKITRQTINAIEGDRYNPSVELVLKPAAFFDCTVEDLFHPDVEVTTTASEASD